VKNLEVADKRLESRETAAGAVYNRRENCVVPSLRKRRREEKVGTEKKRKIGVLKLHEKEKKKERASAEVVA